MKQHSVTKKEIISITLGVLISVIISTIAAASVSAFVLNETLPETSVNLATILIHFAAALSGTLFCTVIAKSKPLVLSLITGAVYYLCLISVNALVMGGQYRGVVLGGICILIASTVVGLLQLKKKSKPFHQIRKYRFG